MRTTAKSAILGVILAAGLAFPAMAQLDLPCDSFERDDSGAWYATQQGTVGTAAREHHFNHEIGGLLEIEHGNPQPAHGDPWHAGGGGSPDGIPAALKHIVCLAAC